MYTIIVESGDLKDSVVELHNKKPIFVGRSDENEIIVDDEKVSRKHCVITLTGDKVTITDLDSTNGTFVNGFAVKERELLVRDCIRVGNTFMTLQKEGYKEKQEEKGLFEQMRKGKGYNTILAEMVGEAKLQDITAILDHKPSEADTPEYLRRELRKRGYTQEETDIIVNQYLGKDVESFPEKLILAKNSPKENEIHLLMKKNLADIKASQIVSYENRDYLVIEIKKNPDHTVTYILKSCS